MVSDQQEHIIFVRDVEVFINGVKVEQGVVEPTLIERGNEHEAKDAEAENEVPTPPNQGTVGDSA